MYKIRDQKLLYTLHMGTIENYSYLNDQTHRALFPSFHFDNRFSRCYPLSQVKTSMPRLFDDLSEREEVYKKCEALAYSYVRRFKEKYEIANAVNYPQNFYSLILLPYYFTLINFSYAKYLYIKKYFSQYADDHFIIDTVDLELPRRFESKKDFLSNLYSNIDFQEWLSSIILEGLKLNNISLTRSKGKVKLFDACTNNGKELPSFVDTLINLLGKKENLLRPHRIFFFILESFVKRLSYTTMSFNNIYGIGPFRRFLYSMILNVKCLKKKDSAHSDRSEIIHPDSDFPDDFIDMLETVIPITIPLSLASLFEKNVKKTQAENTFVQGKIRFDSTGFSDDVKSFKHACSILNGEKLVFVQHGSNYCTTKNSWAADSYEYLGNYFINWGHVRPKQKICQFIIMPSPSLSRLRNKHRFKDTSLILVGTNQRQTMDGICITDPTYSLDYLKSKEIFINSLNKHIFSNFSYRPWPSQDSIYFNDEDYMVSLFPDLKILKGSWIKRMLKGRLVVLDHYGTAFYEAMASNTPVMIYFGYPECAFTSEAKEMFDELKSVGIFYDNAESAAQAVNDLWYDIEGWWLSEKVQKVRAKFTNLYALSDKNWNWQWIKLLCKIS